MRRIGALGLLIALVVGAAAPARADHCRRATGEVVHEPIFAESTLRWFYEDTLGRTVFHGVLNTRWANEAYGVMMDHPASVAYIPGFIERFHIDTSQNERPLAAYKTFNAFFERKLVPGARPFDADPHVLCAPCDGKVLVYPALGECQRLPIKGARCSAAALLGDAALAARYRGGAAFVVRLAPYDYHRFHFPDHGTAAPARTIQGVYHSLYPVAVAHVPDLLRRNKRAVTAFASAHFGPLAIVEVGGITVGSIRQGYCPGPVRRGAPKGRFRNGGSTIVVFAEAGRLVFDADLLARSAEGMEVAVRAGEHVARVK